MLFMLFWWACSYKWLYYYSLSYPFLCDFSVFAILYNKGFFSFLVYVMLCMLSRFGNFLLWFYWKYFLWLWCRMPLIWRFTLFMVFQNSPMLLRNDLIPLPCLPAWCFFPPHASFIDEVSTKLLTCLNEFAFSVSFQFGLSSPVISLCWSLFSYLGLTSSLH